MTSEASRKTGERTMRRDVEPLASRIPALTQVTDPMWFSGTLGDPDAPGPSLYWIDAVVTLPPDVADALRESLDLTPTVGRPGVVDDLVPELPAGDLLAGPQLDEAFSAGGWRSTAFLEASGDRLVLTVVGQ